ncbi:putative homeodomain transcription factor [Lucilia cuprina]|uniref:Putative homeodomain transcription factor n=1 Tax=Lucilia cuprina TaxID=7375 RepID=A0A0L0CND2_LUCCU|nr:putative homeodomain transcription factor [Lucilia cuprina]
MILDEIVSWYQKKIGTYDKEPWEKTVEQKILDGFSSVTLKTAKLKTELIDVDLVRGSTFPKAKPKQSLLTVIRLAVLRYLLLPLYAQWWVKQTSPNAFGLLLFLYITQMINWAVYTFNVNRSELNDELVSIKTNNTNNNAADKVTENEHIVSISELLIPMVLSLFLSLIHSQIVATNIAQSGTKCKRRRYSNTSQNGKPAKENKLRRRKKLVKLRNHDLLVENTAIKSLSLKKYAAGSTEILTKSNSEISSNASTNTATTTILSTKQCYTTSPTATTQDILLLQSHSTTCTSNLPLTQTAASNKLKLNLVETLCPHSNSEDLLHLDNDTECSIRKRNVNWHSPIHKYAITTTTSTQEKQQQTSPQSISTTSSTHTSHVGDNSSISSGSASPVSPTKTVRIDECVQEFYDDLINRTTEPLTKASTDSTEADVVRGVSTVSNARRAVGEDDGFESLNGKSSSGEDTNASPHVTKNQLRLRLNTMDNHQRLQNEPLQQNTTSICYRRKGVNLTTIDNTDYMTTTKQMNSAKPRDISSEETEDESDDGELISSPASQGNISNYNECTTSATEWLGITTNSDDCSYSSEYDNSDNYKSNQYSDENDCDLDFTPTTILNPHGTSDRISCTIWDQREIKKAQMSVLEISSCIIDNVESMPETNDYIYIGIFFSLLLSLIPCFCRLCEVTLDTENPSEINYLDLPMMLWEKASFSFMAIFRFAFGHTQWERTVLVIGLIQRICLTLVLFMIFAVAERTFKQRFLYAKLFSHLTSSRRARKSNLPHFRLNKVRNIKTWLSVRSYLKKRGPQRSVDIIVSAAFIITLLLLAFLSVEWLKDSVHLHSHLNLEALMWSTTIGIFLLRFMTLGNKIHHKYRSVSVLITEQINLYLQIEKKPKKKDELMVSNSVLKLASDLLKELETPFKISGLSANPYLFTTIKVVILSALSGVLSEMLGFKLKLHKIKIK